MYRKVPMGILAAVCSLLFMLSFSIYVGLVNINGADYRVDEDTDDDEFADSDYSKCAHLWFAITLSRVQKLCGNISFFVRFSNGRLWCSWNNYQLYTAASSNGPHLYEVG